MGMMEMDPPDSLKLRKLVVPWFSAKAVELNSGHIRDMVTWCLDRVISAGRCDIVDDLADPLPTLVTRPTVKRARPGNSGGSRTICDGQSSAVAAQPQRS